MPALPGRVADTWVDEGGGGSGGVTVHNLLTGRDAADAHPIAAITDLVAELAALIPLAQKGAANGVATLDAGSKIPAAQIPALALSEFLGTVASEAAMLALVGQRGDWCIRTDLDPDSIFILETDDPTQAANWTNVTGPGVVSVDGLTGAVDLSSVYATPAALNNQIANKTWDGDSYEWPAGTAPAVTPEVIIFIGPDDPVTAPGGRNEPNDLWYDTSVLGFPTEAAAVSFDPAGLAIITDIDVQGALGQLDAAVDGIVIPTNTFQGFVALDPVNLDPVDVSAWSTLTGGVSRTGFTRDSATAVGSYAAWDLPLDAGTWQIAMLHRRWSDRGIYSFQLADLTAGSPGAFTTVATIDGYTAADTQNSFTRSATFAIAAGGLKRLKILMATKNGASSDYRGSMSLLWLYRTA